MELWIGWCNEILSSWDYLTAKRWRFNWYWLIYLFWKKIGDKYQEESPPAQNQKGSTKHSPQLKKKLLQTPDRTTHTDTHRQTHRHTHTHTHTHSRTNASMKTHTTHSVRCMEWHIQKIYQREEKWKRNKTNSKREKTTQLAIFFSFRWHDGWDERRSLATMQEKIWFPATVHRIKFIYHCFPQTSLKYQDTRFLNVVLESIIILISFILQYRISDCNNYNPLFIAASIPKFSD